MTELEVIKTLIKINPKTQDDLVKAGRKISKLAKLPIFKNNYFLELYHKFLKKGMIKENKDLAQLLTVRKIRSLSGVAIITLATKPFPCPGKCLYCPTQKEMPKSYLNNEPAIMRAIRNKFDPFDQVKERIETLERNGHNADKLEIIVIGGTWSFLPKSYQTWFIKRIFEACNYKKSKTLDQAQKINEKTKHRIIGLTIETRPDYINEKEIIRLRKLGVTRIELGVQSLYNDVLNLNKRGHLIERTTKATKLLKDAGFKICYHMMPNLPGSDFKRDIQMFKDLFNNENFKPDMLKVYPCVVLAEAPLYKLYLQKKYKPYTTKQLIKLLKEVLMLVPYYCRVQRVIRDIPEQSIAAGSKVSNLKQYVEEELKKDKLTPKDIRTREIKDNYNPKEKLFLFKDVYKASDGEEIFLSFENKNRTKLYSLLRLRIPSHSLTAKKFFIKNLENSALIREVHTYGHIVPIDKKQLAPQHIGLGKKLIAEAEKITKKYKLNKISVISGIGVREYYKKLGYKLENTYMIKHLK